MSTLRPPTKRQLEVHAFMLSYREQNGLWPSVREIAEAIGVVSNNCVHGHLVALKKKGLVINRVGCARGWIALQPQQEHANA